MLEDPESSPELTDPDVTEELLFELELELESKFELELELEFEFVEEFPAEVLPVLSLKLDDDPLEGLLDRLLDEFEFEVLELLFEAEADALAEEEPGHGLAEDGLHGELDELPAMELEDPPNDEPPVELPPVEFPPDDEPPPEDEPPEELPPVELPPPPNELPPGPPDVPPPSLEPEPPPTHQVIHAPGRFGGSSEHDGS